MKRLLVIGIVLGLAGLVGPARAQDSHLKTLGTDAANDAPPSVDLTSLSVGKVGADLEIQIGVANLLPVQGTLPKAGIEWTFDVGGRTFVAEAHPENGGVFLYTLYQVTNGSFNTVGELEGSVNTADGYISMLVPLSQIGAGKGTVISGTGERGTEDVDVHQHAQVTSQQVDALATTKDYKIK